MLDKNELESCYQEASDSLGTLVENIQYLEKFCKDYDFSKLKNLLNSHGYINMNVESELYKLKEFIDDIDDDEENESD